MAGNREPDAYPAVTVGSEVTTLDGQKVGLIAEVRGRYFKVKTGRFRRDYWLRIDSVRAADRPQTVVLNVPQAQLDGIKIVDIEHLD